MASDGGVTAKLAAAKAFLAKTQKHFPQSPPPIGIGHLVGASFAAQHGSDHTGGLANVGQEGGIGSGLNWRAQQIQQNSDIVRPNNSPKIGDDY